jgi:Raf kinase inhibitor-like YbhB/YbcL family protein
MIPRARDEATAMVAAALLALSLASASFAAGSTLPQWASYGAPGCRGADRSPELHWSDVPRGTRSLALTVYDPDARNGWYHWVAYDLSPRRRSLPAGVRLPPSELGVTSFGERRYGGPCPPQGPPHHYIFTLYALDVRTLALRAPFDGAQLERAVRGHVIARATLVGRYAHDP